MSDSLDHLEKPGVLEALQNKPAFFAKLLQGINWDNWQNNPNDTRRFAIALKLGSIMLEGAPQQAVQQPVNAKVASGRIQEGRVSKQDVEAELDLNKQVLAMINESHEHNDNRVNNMVDSLTKLDERRIALRERQFAMQHQRMDQQMVNEVAGALEGFFTKLGLDIPTLINAQEQKNRSQPGPEDSTPAGAPNAPAVNTG